MAGVHQISCEIEGENMQIKPKVSVIVPVYNTEKYLERCLACLCVQTLKELEVILVDDGSTDGSSAIYGSYLRKYDFFHLVKKENQGLGMARNSGLELVQGEYVAFLDSDDYVAPTYYEEMYGAVREHNADTCITGYTLDKNDGSREQKHIPGKVIEGRDIVYTVLPQLLGAQPEDPDDVVLGMSVWKNLFSMELIRKHNILFYSERQYISEDAIYDMDYYIHARKVVLLDNTDYFYCENGISLSRKYKENRFEMTVILFQEQMRKCALAEEDNTPLVLSIQRSFIGNARYCMQQIYHNLPGDKARGKVKAICENEVLQRVLDEYPYRRNPLRLRIFALCMQRKWAGILLLLIGLSNLKH